MRRALTAWLLLAALAVAAFGLYGREQRARGRAEAALAELRTENARLAAQQARVDTVIRIQRDTLWRRIARVDTLTLTVEQWKHDTIRVVEYVTRADSALRACRALERSCAVQDSLWRVRYRNLEQQLAAVPRPRAPVLVWGERALLAWASFKLGQAAAR